MSIYEDLIKQSRRNFLKLTLEQQKEIAAIYQTAIEELTSKAASAKKKSLTKRWTLDYIKLLKKEQKKLQQNITKSIIEGIKAAGQYSILVDLQIFAMAQERAGIDLGPHFSEMFSSVPDEVLESILRGDLYRDGRGLSERIWRVTNDFGQDIDYIIKRGIAEKKSATDLAKDLEQYIKPASKRPSNWGIVYPNLRTKQVDYNAQRLARTSITHGYREAQYRSAQRNPFVEAIHWELSSQHYARQIVRWGPDECDDYAEQNRYGLGVGNFPVYSVPLSHPQCLCVTYPVIPDSLDKITERLKKWAKGGKDLQLDIWYNKYSEHFTGSEVSEERNIVLKHKSSSTRYKTSQKEIDDIINSTLRNVWFSAPVVYNPRIRSVGKTTAKEKYGIVKIEKIEIGMQSKEGREELIDTLLHEELEARIMIRAFNNNSEKFAQLFQGGDDTIHLYINKVIKRYLKMRGGGLD